MNIFDELPYDEIERHITDELYGYSETTDYEFMSDEELDQLEKDIWGKMITHEI